MPIDNGAESARGVIANVARGGVTKSTPTLRELVGGMESAIERALPIEMNATRFVRMVQTELSKNPKLLECTELSFMGAVLTSAQLGLEFGPLGHAYMIPYRNKGVMEVQFQIGYKGWLALSHRSAKLSTVVAREVRENDEFSYAFGLTDKLVHVPARTDRGAVTDYYCIAKVRGGGASFQVINKAEAQEHRDKYAPRDKNGKVVGPWVSDFDAMAKKTVFKKLFTWLPMSPMMELGAAVDEGVVSRVSIDEEPRVEFDDRTVIDAIVVPNGESGPSNNA